MHYEEIRIQHSFFAYNSAAFKDSLEQQIHLNDIIFWSKDYRCNGDPLYEYCLYGRLKISVPSSDWVLFSGMFTIANGENWAHSSYIQDTADLAQTNSTPTATML